MSFRSVRAVVVLLCVALAASGSVAAGALARAHHRHRSHHRRTSHAVCYARRRHHHRRARRTRCTTRKSENPGSHGHGVAPGGSSGPGSSDQSNNWSGYDQGTIEQGGTLFHSISAQWTVPKATQHSSGQAEDSSEWIGIGGGCIDAGCTLTDPTLIQAGTEQDVGSNGTGSYSAWWEVIPGPSVTITSIAVHPHDLMSASIAEQVPDSNVWTISISDLSDGQSYSITLPYSSTHATAEWIQETPLVLGTGAGFAAEPNLTSPAFDHAMVNGAPTKLKPSEEITLIDSSGKVIGTPSSPDPDGDGFNVCAWSSTCSPPASS